jgi:hypothetical protein
VSSNLFFMKVVFSILCVKLFVNALDFLLNSKKQF